MLPFNAALLVIDLQNAIDHPKWTVHGPRNNPGAEQVVARLLATWREAGRPVFHIRHESPNPDSSYYRLGPGSPFKPEAAPLGNEAVVAKSVHSAFIGTDLEARLRASGIATVVVCGVITNNSVETTVRMAANLGFAVHLVEDACFTFPRPDHAGTMRSAEEVHAMSLAIMDGEYCTVVRAVEVL